MLLFQLCLMSLLSFVTAEETLAATTHGNAWRYGTSGGIVGFIILVLDIIVFLEVLKSNRAPSHKLLWCLVVFIFPVLGLILYYLFSEREKHSGSGSYEVLP